MKKLIYILLVFTLVFSFVGCGDGVPEPGENEEVYSKDQIQSMIDENESKLGEGAQKEKLMLATQDDNYNNNSSVSPEDEYLVYAALDEELQKYKVYVTSKEAQGEVALTNFVDEVPEFIWTEKSHLIIRFNGDVVSEK